MTEKTTISGKNFRHQSFPFRPRFMAYLIETADAKIMQKLHRCCKHFYQVAPYFIVDSIDYHFENLRFEKFAYDDACLECIGQNEIDLFLPTIDNVWVTKKLDLPFSCSVLLNKIVRCEAHFVQIFIHEIPSERYQVLAESGNIESLYLNGVLNPDGSKMFLEDILSMVPNILILRIDGCQVTPQTLTKLNAIPWDRKIQQMFVRFIQGEFDTEELEQFLKVCRIFLS